MDHFLHMLEQRHGVKLPPGRNPNIQFMAHLWEPLRVLPKPLLMYLTSEAVGLATDAALWAMGFKVHRCQVLPCSCLRSLLADACPPFSRTQHSCTCICSRLLLLLMTRCLA